MATKGIENWQLTFRRWHYGSVFIHFHIVVSESKGEKSSQTDDKERFQHKMAPQGHSRSIILGSPEANKALHDAA